MQLSGLLRPLIQAKWMDLVLRFNRQFLQDPGPFDFLFGSHRVSTRRVCGSLRELQGQSCLCCGDRLRSAADVDHFLPWSRWPDNGIENLVAAHPGCNNQKRDFIAAAEHLKEWTRRFDPASALWRDLESIAGECNWDRHPDRTRGVARSLHLRLPDDAELCIEALTAFLEMQGIETEDDLRAWLADPDRAEAHKAELLELPGIGPKTVDYLRILRGGVSRQSGPQLRRQCEPSGPVFHGVSHRAAGILPVADG